MVVATNVPGVTFGPNGVQLPSEQAVLDGVMADYNTAFGGGLNPSLSTPQGQLASSTTAIIAEANNKFLKQSTQIDPAYAEGRWQDAIGRIYFLERDPSEPTVVQARCTGGARVIIPAGALAKAEDGNIYVCTEAGEIAGTGFVVLPFACQIPGPIVCPAGSLNTIYQSVNGWDSITNDADGVIGRDVESREAFEERRAASVALNSRGSLPSVQAAVLDVPGVLDAYVTENNAAAPVVAGGATLAGKSLYVAAVGGGLDAIANAIWSKKAPGCGYNGNTTRNVFDTAGYDAPYPTYPVTFEVPPALPILFAVNILNGPLVPADAVTQIQNTIIKAFSGSDGGPRARIGSTILASRYIAPVSLLGWAQIVSLLVGSANVTQATFTGAIAGTTLTTSGVTGAIAVGQTISNDAGTILPGTIITAGSGSSWTINKSQTVGSGPVKAVRANANQVVVNINQVPTISADNIAVTIT